MKKQMLIIGMVAMLVTSTSGLFTVSAAHRHHRHHHEDFDNGYDRRMQAKKDARWVLGRTARVLQRAQEMAADRRDDGHRRRHHGRRHGMRHRGLGRAFAFQQRARDLFFQGDYDNAIQLSLHSRAIAIRVIRRMEGWDNDNGNWRDDDDNLRNCDMDRNEMDDVEVRYWERRPDDSKLDVHINGRDVDDDAAVSFHLDLDF